MTDPKILMKASLAPIHFSLEGRARAGKKRDYQVKIFQKCPKTPFLACFIKIVEMMSKKKQKLSTKDEKVWKTAPPPLEKILNPP